MALDKHILTVCRSLYVEIKRTSFIRQYLTVEATISLAFGFVLSRLDYCNDLSNLPSLKTTERSDLSHETGFQSKHT